MIKSVGTLIINMNKLLTAKTNQQMEIKKNLIRHANLS